MFHFLIKPFLYFLLVLFISTSMVLAGPGEIKMDNAGSSNVETKAEIKETIDSSLTSIRQINKMESMGSAIPPPLPSNNSQSPINLAGEEAKLEKRPPIDRAVSLQSELPLKDEKPLTVDNNTVQPTVLLVYEKPSTGPSSPGRPLDNMPAFQPARVVSIQSTPVQADSPKNTATYDMASNVGARAYYAGVGLNVDVINPRGHTEASLGVVPFNVKSEFNNTASGAHLSPKIFIGMEQEDLYKGWGLRLQLGVDFHTIHIEKKENFLIADDDDGGLGLLMKFRFNYTFNFTAQLKKKILENLDGYVGLSALATWAQIAHSYYASGDGSFPLESGESNRFIFGVSPAVGLIYHLSNRMFCYLDGHVAFYQRAAHEGIAIAEALRFDTRMEPIWAGIGVGIGWKL